MNPQLPAIHEIWVYLSGSPLLALILTLSAYQAGVMIYERFDRNPLANPVAIAIAIVATVITLIDMPYAKYFEGAQFVHFLLGTATVALAVPIYKGLEAMRGRILPLLAALLAGGATSIVSAVGIAKLLGADAAIVGGFYAKSVTAPIAMGVAERIDVSPTLTAVFAVTTGILGAILVRFVMDAIGMKSWWQRGFARGRRRARHRHLARLQRASRGGHLREPRDGTARRAGRGADSARRSSPRLVAGRRHPRRGKFFSRAAELFRERRIPTGLSRIRSRRRWKERIWKTSWSRRSPARIPPFLPCSRGCMRSRRSPSGESSWRACCA